MDRHQDRQPTVGTHPVVGQATVGHVDNSSFPAINVDIQMTLVTPADAKGPVPVMMMFGGPLPALPRARPAPRGAAAGPPGGFPRRWPAAIRPPRSN